MFGVEVTGDVQRRALVTVDPDLMMEKGVSLFQISRALRENNITLPGGAITDGGRVLPIKTTNAYESLDELRSLVVGFPVDFGGQPGQSGQPGRAQSEPPAPVTLGDVADVSLGAGQVTSISRTNGKRSLGVSVIKEPDANTIDVTEAVNQAMEDLGELPPDIEIVTISDDGPEIQGQINTLEREAVLGLILAVMVVFAFFMTLRPTAIRGALNTLRPTVVIGLSIPLKYPDRRHSDELAGPVAQLHDSRRLGYIGRKGRGRQHRRLGERVPQHPGRQGEVARRARRYDRSRAGHHRVHADHNSRIRPARLYTGIGRRLLLPVRAHRQLRSDCVASRRADRRSRAWSLPAQAGRPARGRPEKRKTCPKPTPGCSAHTPRYFAGLSTTRPSRLWRQSRSPRRAWV